QNGDTGILMCNEYRLYRKVALDHFVQDGVQRRHDRCNNHFPNFLRIDLFESKEIPQQDAEFVDSPVLLRRQTPMHDKPLAVVNTENGIRIAEINCQEHLLSPKQKRSSHKKVQK